MEIWERQDYDTDLSFRAFCIYRDMGAERSLLKVAEQLNQSVKHIEKWSAKKRWTERAAAYDNYLDRHKRELMLKNIEDINKKQIEQSIECAQSLQIFIDIINKKIEQLGSDMEKMKLDELVKMSGTLSKSLPEIIATLQKLINTPVKESEDLSYLDSISKDEKASHLAAELLLRISELNGGTDNNM